MNKKRGFASLPHPVLPTFPNDWFTPEDLFAEISEKYGPFDLDVAATPENTKCERFYTEEEDGRLQPWDGRVWCNPPYRNLISWVTKAWEETSTGRCPIAVLLLPAQTSTDWFHDYALPLAELYWIRRKRKFGGAKGRGTVSSLVVVFRSFEEELRRAVGGSEGGE